MAEDDGEVLDREFAGIPVDCELVIWEVLCEIAEEGSSDEGGFVEEGPDKGFEVEKVCWLVDNPFTDKEPLLCAVVVEDDGKVLDREFTGLLVDCEVAIWVVLCGRAEEGMLDEDKVIVEELDSALKVEEVWRVLCELVEVTLGVE